jgi:hypothetical protein
LKAVQIGNVSRTIKEIAVDCILNYQQGNFNVENMKQTVNLELSSGGTLEYQIGDKPYSAICDYMKKCSYTCKPAGTTSEAGTSEAGTSEAGTSEAGTSEEKEIINNETYGEAFILLNNDKIIFKIKMLFKERFFYRKTQLVVLLNTQKSYPLMQINAALNQMIEDKNEYLTDKYGRLGNLVNIGDLYLFQPLELTNEHISLLDRSMPVEFKHDTISIDLKETQLVEEKTPVKEKSKKDKKTSKELVEAIREEAEVEEEEEAEVEEEEAITEVALEAETYINSPTKELLERMVKNYNLSIVPNKPKRGEENWYKACSEVIDEMQKLGFERNNLLDALVGHICDDLLFEDKMLLLNNISSISDKDEFTERVERYLYKDTLKNKGLTGLFVLNKGVLQLYIKNANVASASALALAQAEDKYDLETPIATLKSMYLPPKAKLGSVVGFVSNFKKEENNIVFKMKVFTLKGIVKKRNKGARCYGKSLEMMEEIMGEETLRAYLDLIHIKYKDIIEEKKKNRILNKTEQGVIDELESINHMHACVVQEMFLRTYNILEKNSKKWFLTPEEALLVDIENATF